MKKLVGFLRDPVWQMIGALIGAVALFFTFYGGTADRKSLSIIHYFQVTFPGQWLVSEKFKLTYEGESHKIGKTFFDYYLVINDSKGVIKPDDFFQPLTVSFSEPGVKIISVEACSLKYADLYGANSNSSGANSYINTSWARVGASGEWSAKPQLFNSGDVACVIVVSERVGVDSGVKSEIFPEWQTRVAGHKTPYYKDRQSYSDSFERRVEDYFYVGVILENFGILWFLLFFSLIFMYSMKISYRAGYLNDQRYVYYRLLLMALASVSTSEIIVDIYINNDGDYSSDKLHVIVWPLLFFHFVFLIYLTRKALLKTRD